MIFLRQMRVKLTTALPPAFALLLLSCAYCQESRAFPFFHRKPDNQAKESGHVTSESPADASVAPTGDAPATFTPSSPYGSSQLKNTQSGNLQSTPSPVNSFANTNSSSALQPANPSAVAAPIIHSPPAVPERPPIPPPPAVQAPIMVLNGEPTPSLSWRAVAYKLWTTPEALPPKRSKSQSSFPFSTAMTMKALIKALSESGWNTSQYSASAGHLLAIKSDTETNRMRLIFAAHPGEGGNTVVRVATDPDSKNFDKNQLESIFSRAQDIAARNDLL